MTQEIDIAGRLRRAEEALREADRLLQRRRTELGGQGGTEFEDRLLQGVRELGAALRELAADGGHDVPVSASHASELDAQASDLDETDTWQGHGVRPAQ